MILALLMLVLVSTLPQPQPPDGSPPQELIGDLRFRQITAEGITIANIILSAEPGESSLIGTPSPKGSCKQSTDSCCIWYEISADLTKDF
jgi:hypothetical protein